MSKESSDMKKTGKILLFSALGCVALGAVMMIGGAAMTGFDGGKLLSDNRKRKTTEISQSFDKVTISTDIDNVELISAEGKTVLAEVFESDRMYYDISVKNNTLNIQFVKDKPWYSFITDIASVSSVGHTVKVFLPVELYKEVTVRTDIGSVTIPAEFQIEKLSIETDIGSVDVPKARGANGITKIRTDIGDITLHVDGSEQNDNLLLDTDIGNIKIKKSGEK
jgi:hypothetical protein